ncbi:MAG: hypothetical protein HY816_23465 [Candidatus Wallbacteria bacterium]|nr:hypothetical protein [Candidatus Wallbacteria bacterium]
MDKNSGSGIESEDFSLVGLHTVYVLGVGLPLWMESAFPSFLKSQPALKAVIDAVVLGWLTAKMCRWVYDEKPFPESRPPFTERFKRFKQALCIGISAAAFLAIRFLRL